MFSFKHYNWSISVDLIYKGAKSVRVIELARSSHKPLMIAVCASLLLLSPSNIAVAAGPDIDRPREMDGSVRVTDYDVSVFKADPTYEHNPYSAEEQIKI